MNAIVTGGTNGLLGPVWVKVLRERFHYMCPPPMPSKVDIFDLPDYNSLYPTEVESFCEGYEEEPPDIIIHNAAIDPKPGSPDGKNPFRRHEDIMQVNHGAVVHMNEILTPRMIDNGGGVIIIIGSIMGYISARQSNYSDGWTKAFAYNESKAALISHCHNINTTFGKDGIRCVMPSFGPFEKGLSKDFMEGFGKKIPIRKAVSEEDLKRTLQYCIECESLAGEFRIDGGYSRQGA